MAPLRITLLHMIATEDYQDLPPYFTFVVD